MACTGGGAITVVATPATGEVFTGRTLTPRRWLTLGFDDMDRGFALDAYNHPPAYYGGSKYGHVIHFGTVTRQLSDRFSSYKMANCTIEVDNTSRLLDSLETAAASQYWANRQGRIYLASEATIAAGGTPHTVFRGIWRGHKSNGLRRSLTFTDILGSSFSDFNLEATLPKRKVTLALIAALGLTGVPDGVEDSVVPIAYGRWSDTAVTTTQVGTTLPFNAALPSISSAGCADVSGGTLSGPVGFIVTGVKSGQESPISNMAGTVDYNRSVRGGWNQDLTFDSYNIYFFGGPSISWLDWTPQGGVKAGARVDWVRKFTHDNVTLDGPDTWFPRQMYKQINSITDGTDALTGVTTASVDKGTGMVAPRYLGLTTLANGPNHTWLLAGHAVQDIHELYVNGLPVNILTDAVARSKWKIPGFAEWTSEFGSTPYRVINGETMVLIYGLAGSAGPDAAAGLTTLSTTPVAVVADVIPFAVNFCAIEDVGNATGSTITRAPRVVYHLLDQWGIQSYMTGAWAAPSASTDGIPWLNSFSFNALEAIEINRVGGEGYLARLYIDKPITIRELLSKLLINFDMRFGPNEHGQVIAKHLDDFFDLSTAAVVTDVSLITEDTDIDRRLEELENKVIGDYGWRPAKNAFDTQGAEVKDDVAITNNRNLPVVGDRRVLDYCADAATALDVMGRALTIGKYPPRYVDITCNLPAITIKLGDIISVTDKHGIGVNGWQNQALWVLGIQTMLNDLVAPVQIKLMCLDVKPFFAEVGVMGDGGVLNNWATDTAAQKTQYLYMCDGTTGLFADGSPGKGMR